MDYVFFASAVFLLLSAAALGWLMTLMGLPGNWLMVSAAGLYAWLGPVEGNASLGWGIVAMMTAVAAIGELAELVTSVWGARRAGGSRRAAVFALLGSLVGAVAGAIVGIPVPIIGSPVAALLGGAVGALIGAAFGEHSRGESPGHSWRVGHAAFWGRVLGTGVKTIAATVIAVAIAVALIF
ncbi:MAG: DUF456 domain-containing protein [Planctomycetes bacterium]|nr:DUF456 domain-containing protein [Planctomycetota bacterium]